ncbi:MAG: hypothetical protein ACE5FQ_11655 [Thiogranum sp.]
MTLAAPGDNITDEKITLGDKFPDPNDILYQPLNPRAGVEWSKKTSHYSGSEMDVAYTKAQQATSAINKRAREWTAIKTGLAAKDSDLAAGKQVCVKSGKNNYCYRLGAQTGYVDKAVPTGQTTTQLTDGTPIIADDVSDAQANKLAAVATITEPKWFLCHTKTSVINDVDAEMYFPGVVVHMNNCVFSEGKNKYNQHQFKVVKGGTDLFWQPAGNGYLPSSAAVTGRLSLNTETGIIDATNMKTGQLTGSTMAAYSCRAMIGRKTKIGWTIGGKYCHITTFAGGAVVKNFEVLTVNGSIAAPPPPPPPAQPKCTYQMVENYFYGKTWKPHCTPDQYNREHPDCHFQSRKMGFCDGGPP